MRRLKQLRTFRGTFIWPTMMSFCWRSNGHFSRRNVCLLSGAQEANRNLHTGRRCDDYTDRQTTCSAHSSQEANIDFRTRVCRDWNRNQIQQFIDHLTHSICEAPCQSIRLHSLWRCGGAIAHDFQLPHLMLNNLNLFNQNILFAYKHWINCCRRRRHCRTVVAQ